MQIQSEHEEPSGFKGQSAISAPDLENVDFLMRPKLNARKLCA